MASEVNSKETVLKAKKEAHDYVATAVQVMTTRVQFFYEEFEGVHQSVQFLRSFRDQIAKEIHELEPPTQAEAEPAKPYLMDLTHVKPSEDASPA